MSFTNQTTHYGLPQWIGSDKPTYLVDQNNAYQTIDSELYNANTAAGEAVTTAQGAVTTAEGAASTAATALNTAQGAETTANTADGKADNAITLAQSAQTAAGAAQTAAEAAQTAAAGNSITNLAPAYDPSQTYNVDALVTQDGKLYQCITQVSSPEAFDINKWDDKTCSEVFQKVITGSVFSERKKYTIPGNTHSNYEDALLWIVTHPSDILGLADNEIATNGHIYISGYGHFFQEDAGVFTHLSTSLTTEWRGFTLGSTNATLSRLSVYPNNCNFYEAITTTTGTTFNSRNSTAQAAIDIYFDIFKTV